MNKYAQMADRLYDQEQQMKRLEEENKELKEVHESDKRSLRLIAEKGVELEKEISILLSCKNCSENKGGYICQKEYEDKCLAQKIQYIKELQKENTELEEKLNNLSSVAEVRLANWQKYEKENKELKMENNLAKSLLYCTKRTCDNCGFVNCENFQRQRKSEPCALYISYQDRIKNLTNESDVLRESFNNSEMNLSFVSEQLTKAIEILKKYHNECPVKYSFEDIDDMVEQFLKGCE